MTHNLLALFINLDRSPDRRALMERQLDALGVNWHRFEGIDGAILSEEVLARDRALFARCHGRQARPTDVGSYMSHLGALAAFLESGEEFGLILEDDAILDERVERVLALLTSEDTPRDWDFVKLQSRRNTRTMPVRCLDETYTLAVSFTRSTGATAYLVNRTGAAAMIERLDRVEAPFDHTFDRPLHLGIRSREVVPYPVTLDEVANNSTIETSRRVKVSGFAKLPVLWWRTRAETQRVLWASGVVAATAARRLQGFWGAGRRQASAPGGGEESPRPNGT